MITKNNSIIDNLKKSSGITNDDEIAAIEKNEKGFGGVKRGSLE